MNFPAYLRIIVASALFPALVGAQVTPPGSAALTVDRTTGVIIAPVTAQKFRTANNLSSSAIIYASDYGAVGNDSTDSRSAIQQALDAVTNKGGIVMLPAGRVRLGGTVYINKAGITFQGEGPGTRSPHFDGGWTGTAGTHLVFTNANDGIRISPPASAAATARLGGITLRDFSIEGTGKANGYTAINATLLSGNPAIYGPTDDMLIDRVSVVNFQKGAVLNRTDATKVDRTWITECTTGIENLFAVYTQITNSVVADNFGTGIYIEGSIGGVVANNAIVRNGAQGLELFGATSLWAIHGNNFVNDAGNYEIASFGNLLKFGSGVTKNSVIGNTFSAVVGSGFSINDASTGNSFGGNIANNFTPAYGAGTNEILGASSGGGSYPAAITANSVTGTTTLALGGGSGGSVQTFQAGAGGVGTVLAGAGVFQITSADSAANPMRINATNSASQASIQFSPDTRSWIFGAGGSTSGLPNSFYLYDMTAGAVRLAMRPNGNLLVGGTTDIAGAGGLKVFGTTASTDTTTGAFQVAGGAAIGGALNVGLGVKAAGQIRTDMGASSVTSLIATGTGSNLQIYHPASGPVRVFNSSGAGIDLSMNAAGAGQGPVSAPQFYVTGGTSLAGSWWTSAAGGMIFQGKTGTLYDLLFATPAGASIMGVATGTTTLKFEGDAQHVGTTTFLHGGVDGTLADQLYFAPGAYPTFKTRIRTSNSSVPANNKFVVSVGTGNGTDLDALTLLGNGNATTSGTAAAGYIIHTTENTSSTGYTRHNFSSGTAGANGIASVKYAPGILFQIGPDQNDTTTPLILATNNNTARLTISAAGGVSIPGAVTLGTPLGTASGGTGGNTPLAARIALGINNFQAHGNSGATEAFSALTDWHAVTLDQNSAFSFTDWPATGTAAESIVLEILQGASPYTVTWTGVASPPAIDPTPGSTTLVTLSSRDGGATIYANTSYYGVLSVAVGSITGMGSNVAAFLATPTGANLAAALTTPLPQSKGGSGATSAAGAWVTSTVATVTTGTTTIDWALGPTHSRTLAGNTTYGFANALDGQTIVVAVTNTASNYTVTWPTVVWKGGAAPVQTVGAKTDILTFIKIGSTIYGSSTQNFY